MDFETAVYNKVTGRLIPFLFACYILAYVDRVNIGFAKLQMQRDLGMSETVYGTGAGIFFIGYFLFEVPANMMLQRLGARLWLGGLMVLWGAVSCCTVLARGAASFYAIRMLLGIVESGFFPGVILYLTFWYTRTHRGRIVALFMAATPLSGVLAGPISGRIMAKMSGMGGLRAWQWLFLLEGIPSAIAGLVTMFYLVDGPGKAKWLSQKERDYLTRRLHQEEEVKKSEGPSRHRIADAFGSGRVWLCCAIYFGFQMGNYGLAFWLPQILKDTVSTDPWRIGLVSSIPWALAATAMIFYGHHSDKTGERRKHVAVAAALAGAAFAVGGVVGPSGTVAVALVSLSAIGIMCGQSVFWSLPTAVLSGAGAAAGIAWINSVGNLGGYVSPFVIGRIRDRTGSTAMAQLVLAGSCLAAAAIAWALKSNKGASGRPAVLISDSSMAGSDDER
jgi:D-galactonate transporter